MKRKISVTTGTRAEYGIMKPILDEIVKSKKLELCLIVAGMHLSNKYGNTVDEIKKDGFEIFSKVKMLPSEDSLYGMSKSLGKGIIEFSNIFRKLKPDINLVLGDRDEMLASTVAAYHMNIPNAHIHGGDRSQGGIDEYNRHAITKMSNIHFAATKKSQRRIIKMGENPKFVFLTGSPSIDQIRKNHITSKTILEKKYHVKFNGTEILLLQHPVTTQTESSKNQILNTLRAIKKLKKTTIALAPNSDAGNKIISSLLRCYSKKYDFIHVYKSIPRSDFLGMLNLCGVLVGNSSSGMIEASYFNIPVVNIGIRQEGRERGRNVLDSSNNANDIRSTILLALKRRDLKHTNEFLYGKGFASNAIVKILEKINLGKELIEKKISY
ncbi:MAG TPA: UDP-N-acetylglucosamine 2-epimerase [Verrucomicrobiae bacterium]|nr:UDP-N-acetylglucosamine 2-epimerase [Verrucomicrobiae bacterium]